MVAAVSLTRGTDRKVSNDRSLWESISPVNRWLLDIRLRLKKFSRRR